MTNPFAAAVPTRLHPDWRVTLRHAWSIRWIVVAGLLGGVETVFSLLAGDPPIPLRWFAPLSFLTTAAAFWARLAAQRNYPGSDA